MNAHVEDWNANQEVPWNSQNVENSNTLVRKHSDCARKTISW